MIEWIVNESVSGEPDPRTLRAVEDSSAERVALVSAEIQSRLPDRELAAASECDLLHAGLLLGGAGTFRAALLASPSWLLLDPRPDRRAVSWKATGQFCVVRPEAVRGVGGFDTAYRSTAAQLMDLAYRLIRAGGRVAHDPRAVSASESPSRPCPIPLNDELLFLCRHAGLPAARYAAAWLAASRFSAAAVYRALSAAVASAAQHPAPARRAESAALSLLSDGKRQSVGSVSAIIPTLDRYDYLPKAIESLLEQRPAPLEIVVVDQTPTSRRQPSLYDAYAARGVRVVFLDRAGQSLARNTAVREATGDWCLLFDDDSVAWEGMLAEHIALVEQSGAFVSTGASLAPWKTLEHLDASLRHPQLTSVLDTGNCLIRRDAYWDVGGLDPAFDHGSGADNDLGTRLHLAGYEILFNPKAVRTHYKAPRGGLRAHGAWWPNKTTMWGPYPPPTQLHTLRSHYPPLPALSHALLGFSRARATHKPFELAWLYLNAPWKLALSLVKARRLARLSAPDPAGRAAAVSPAPAARRVDV